MAQAILVTVKRNNVLLFGEKRKTGDTIDTEKYYGLSLNVRRNLESSGIVEVIAGTLTNEEMSVRLGELQQRIQVLEKLFAESNTSEKVSAEPTKIIGTSETTRKAKKGDVVEFEHTFDDGIVYLVAGVVQSVKAGIATIHDDVGTAYECPIHEVLIK